MADLTRFLTYYIVLTDPDLLKQLQVQFPDGYQYAPATGAAVAFSAPWAGSFPGTDPNHVASGTYFGPAPYTYAPEWISLNNYDATVATFQRHSGGFWGMGGTTVRYYWVGQFVLAEPAVPTVSHVVPPAPLAPPTRRFVEGWEFGFCGVHSGITQGQYVSRDASRHVGGMGLALRGPGNTSGIGTVTQDAFGATLRYRTWMRMYIRLRKPDPGSTVIFWGTGAASSSGHGIFLAIAPDGRLALYMNDSGGTRVLLATASDPFTAWNGDSTANGWHKLDVLLRYNPNEAGTGGHPPAVWPAAVTDGPFTKWAVQVYIDGAVSMSASGTGAAFGLGLNSKHKTSFVGTPQGTSELYLDVDDWTESDWPGQVAGGESNGDGFGALTSADFLSGTKIVAARAKQFGAGHLNWTGDFRIALQNPLNANTASAALTSAIASAIAEVDLDIDVVLTKDTGMKGVSALMVHAFTTHAVSQGQLGYNLNAAGFVMATIGESVTLAGFAIRKSLADGAVTTLGAVTSLSVRKTKFADANAATIKLLGAQIELNGLWGLEDYRLTENGASGAPVFPRFVGQHNAPYPYSIYGKGTAAPPPNSPVVVTSGTYVGNGTGQDITFRTPPTLIVIRPLAGDTGGIKWWSSLLGGHLSAQQAIQPTLARLDQDTTFVPGLGLDLQQERYRMRLASGDTQLNAVGVTYQYFAFSDPGARFALAGAMMQQDITASVINNLINPAYTPEAALFLTESVANSSAPALYFKGLGVPADTLFRWTASAQLAAGATFGVGSITTQAAFHALALTGTGYLCFRRHDGNNDPGEPSVLALANWTGDGSASRSVSLAPASGKRPIFAMVFASDAGGGFMRDVSHTANTSTKDNGTGSATGITGGGIDTLSVGSSLNANGVNYSAIVFLGSATAGNGGFGINGEYIPVEAAPPVDGPFPTPTLEDFVTPPPVVVPLTGEPDLEAATVLSDSATDLGGLIGGHACEYYTRHVANIALSRIGVSTRIDDLANEQTQEAIVARSHILEDVNAVLRAFEWPFATRYAELVLVGGTADVPVNQDWQYSYRAPNAMMKARRLVGQGGQKRNFDPNPIQFALGADAVGPVIYTDAVASSDVPLVLEYTVRSICPALYGDALFRNALGWKFAESWAMPLAKDSKKQDYCRARFEAAIASATVPAANEAQKAPAGDAPWILDRTGGSTTDPWGDR